MFYVHNSYLFILNSSTMTKKITSCPRIGFKIIFLLFQISKQYNNERQTYCFMICK